MRNGEWGMRNEEWGIRDDFMKLFTIVEGVAKFGILHFLFF